MWSAFEEQPEDTAALLKAAQLARANGQLVAWDNSEREYAIAVYHEQTQELQPLTDEEAAILLNRDSKIRRSWRKWNAASRNRGSLIILDSARALRILRTERDGSDEEDDVRGLA
jgi:hypothetical protein